MNGRVAIVDAANEAERGLSAIFAEAFGVASVGPSADFFELGGDSLLAVGLLLRVEEVFGRTLPLDILIERPTVRALSQYLSEPEPVERRAGVVTIQAGVSRTALFCLPGLGGNVLEFHHLRKRLQNRQTIYALPTLGATDGEAVHATVNALAEHVVARIRSVQPKGPYHLLGYSLGGVVAFETALRLRAAGEEVALLAMLDSTLWSPEIELSFWRRMRAHWDILSKGPLKERARYVRDRLRSIANRVRRLDFKRKEENVVDGLPLSAASRKIAEVHWLAWRDYRPRLYDQPIVLFRAALDPDFWTAANEADPALGWGQWTSGGVTVHNVSGTHTALLHVEKLSLLDTYLEHPPDLPHDARGQSRASLKPIPDNPH